MRQRFTIDWRDAWRSLRATPLVTAIAVLSLALGIGANTALFSILNSLILKSLPVRDAEELVMVGPKRVDQPDLGADSRARARARRRRLRMVERFVRLVPGRTDGPRRGTLGQRTDVRGARRADDPRPNAHRGRRCARRRPGRRRGGDQLWVLAAAIRRRGRRHRPQRDHQPRAVHDRRHHAPGVLRTGGRALVRHRHPDRNRSIDARS